MNAGKLPLLYKFIHVTLVRIFYTITLNPPTIVMKPAAFFSRLLLGIIFLVFGLDFFLHFVSNVVPLPGLSNKADNYLTALTHAEYFFPILKVIEILGGLGLIINRYTALFIAGLLPITFNIFLFDVFLGYQLLPLGIAMLVMNIFLLFAYRKYYRFLFTVVPRV